MNTPTTPHGDGYFDKSISREKFLQQCGNILKGWGITLALTQVLTSTSCNDINPKHEPIGLLLEEEHPMLDLSANRHTIEFNEQEIQTVISHIETFILSVVTKKLGHTNSNKTLQRQKQAFALTEAIVKASLVFDVTPEFILAMARNESHFMSSTASKRHKNPFSIDMPGRGGRSFHDLETAVFTAVQNMAARIHDYYLRKVELGLPTSGPINTQEVLTNQVGPHKTAYLGRDGFEDLLVSRMSKGKEIPTTNGTTKGAYMRHSRGPLHVATLEKNAHIYQQKHKISFRPKDQKYSIHEHKPDVFYYHKSLQDGETLSHFYSFKIPLKKKGRVTAGHVRDRILDHIDQHDRPVHIIIYPADNGVEEPNDNRPLTKGQLVYVQIQQTT